MTFPFAFPWVLPTRPKPQGAGDGQSPPCPGGPRPRSPCPTPARVPPTPSFSKSGCCGRQFKGFVTSLCLGLQSLSPTRRAPIPEPVEAREAATLQNPTHEPLNS